MTSLLSPCPVNRVTGWPRPMSQTRTAPSPWPPPERARVPSRDTARLTGDAVWPARVHRSRAAPVVPGAVVEAVGAVGPPGVDAAAGPKGERPIQSSQPPTPLASATTATAAAIAWRRIIRRR